MIRILAKPHGVQLIKKLKMVPQRVAGRYFFGARAANAVDWWVSESVDAGRLVWRHDTWTPRKGWLDQMVSSRVF